jgi:hypothetical protein
MTRGKNFFSMTEFDARMPHETVTDPNTVNTRFTLDAGSKWHTEAEPSLHKRFDCEASRTESSDTTNQIEDHGVPKAKQTVPKLASNYRVSSLKRTKLKLHGKVSELITSKLHKRKVVSEVEEEPSVDLGLAPEQVSIEAKTEPVIPRIEDTKVKIPEVSVQVVPTPAKKRRSSKVELVPKYAKPLKVIRRRREEAPKIFETAPKDYPKSILEGIKVGYDEERDNPPK